MADARVRSRVVVALVLVVGVLLAARLYQVHSYGWEWTVFPSDAPPKIVFEGRDYERGRERPGGVPAGYVRRGTTLGGGRIYQDAADTGTSTVVYVGDGSHVYGYELIGGP
jgi:hypothetical protein